MPSFCGKRQTLNHILNCCDRSLNDGRYTFRHDCILVHYINQCIDKQKFQCYIDIDGEQTDAGGTLPPSIIVSNPKPDIVIVDKKQKTVSIFELTVPVEHRIEISEVSAFPVRYYNIQTIRHSIWGWIPYRPPILLKQKEHLWNPQVLQTRHQSQEVC